MQEQETKAIGAYIQRLFLPADPRLEGALLVAQAEGLPSIQVPYEVGRLLSILAGASGARRILEIGTLGGFSAMHLARSLPADGQIVSLEVNSHHADVARRTIAQAGLADRVDVRVGPALESLPGLVNEPQFDMAFIDADKPSYPAYFEWCRRLVRVGGLIVADNVLVFTAVNDPNTTDERGRAMDAMNRAAASDPGLLSIILPVRDGRDGVLIAFVTAPLA